MPFVDHGETSTHCRDDFVFPPRFKLRCPPLVSGGEISREALREKLERGLGSAAGEAVRSSCGIASPPLAPGDPSDFAFRGKVEAASKLLRADHPPNHLFYGKSKRNSKAALVISIAGFSIVAGLALSGVGYFVIPSQSTTQTDIAAPEVASKIPAAGAEVGESSVPDSGPITVVQQSAALEAKREPTTAEPGAPNSNNVVPAAKVFESAALSWPGAPDGTPAPVPSEAPV